MVNPNPNTSVHDSLFMRALRCEPTSRTPVWLMRQAGRYLPEYREVRKRAGSFMDLCRNTSLACEVTLQPLARFKLDAAILFSDILTIPDAMGLGLSFVEGEGPTFAHPIRGEQAIHQLPKEGVLDKLTYVMDAVSAIRRNMPKELPLIGFSGSPWTLACYMIDGGSSRDFHHTRTHMYDIPHAMHALLTTLSDVIAAYLIAQVEAGANALMLFDTWGGLLSTSHYLAFSRDYMARIVRMVKDVYPKIPLIVFTKGGGQWLPAIAETQCDGIGLDWTTDIASARAAIGNSVALQGNLDPMVLLASPEVIRTEVKRILDAHGSGPGHIFNLGHGITPNVPPEHVEAMVSAVSELSHK